MEPVVPILLSTEDEMEPVVPIFDAGTGMAEGTLGLSFPGSNLAIPGPHSFWSADIRFSRGGWDENRAMTDPYPDILAVASALPLASGGKCCAD